MSPKIVTSRDQLPNQSSSIESILGIAIIPKIEREKRETLSVQGEKSPTLLLPVWNSLPTFMLFRVVFPKSTNRRMGSACGS